MMTYDKDLNVVFIPYKTYKDIPLEDFKTLHREYWTILSQLTAENPDIFKVPIYSSITRRTLGITHKCFACEYAWRIGRGGCFNDCEFCPIKIWRDAHNSKEDPGCEEKFEGNPYIVYVEDSYAIRDELKCFKTQSELAIEIANLEWEDLHDK